MAVVRSTDFKLPVGVGLSAPFQRVGKLAHHRREETELTLLLWLSLGQGQGLAFTVGERGDSYLARRRCRRVIHSWLFLSSSGRHTLTDDFHGVRPMVERLSLASPVALPPLFPTNPLEEVLWEQAVTEVAQWFAPRALEAFMEERFILPRRTPERARVQRQAALASGLPESESRWPQARLIYGEPGHEEVATSRFLG